MRPILHIFVCTVGLILSQISGLKAQNAERDTSLGSLESLLDTKISTATKYAQTTSQAPASVTIITADDIATFGYQTLEDVMMSVRGFYTSNDRNYAYIGARGFGRPTDYNNRILLLLNGHTINDNVYGSAPFGTEMALDLGAVERIEIVRGPGSALYGKGAMFAVVNLITKKGYSVNGLTVTAKTGSFGKTIGSLTYGNGLKNGLDIAISAIDGNIKGQNLYYKEYDDSSTNYGMAENLDQDKFYGALTTVSYRSFSFQGFGSSREKEVPTGAWNAVFNTKPSKTLDQWSHIELKYDSRFISNKNVMIRTYFDHFYYKGWLPYDLIQKDASTGNLFGSELQFRWDFRANTTLTIGTEYQRDLKITYKVWDEDTVYFDKNISADNWSFYCQNEYQITKELSFTIGLRYDRDPGEEFRIMPRGAIIYRPFNSSTLKLLYGEAYREPTIYESDYYDELGGYKANLALKDEMINTAELVWEQHLAKNIMGVILIYSYGMKNLINEVIDPDDSLFQYRNVSSVRANGLELGCDARPQSGLAGFVNYVYQEAKDSNTDKKLTNSPNHMLKAGVSYPIQRYFYVGGQFAYESERLTVQETKTKQFILTSLNFRYAPRPAKYSNWGWLADKLEISFQVRNLFDVEYAMPAGFEHRQAGINQDGRSYIFQMRIKL